MDTIFDRLVSSRRSAWEDFRCNHPWAWTALYQGYRLYQQKRHFEYRALHRRFRDFTRLSRSAYCDNLALCDGVRHLPGAVVECGVWKGGMSAGMASVLGDGRTYYLYDSFEGLPPASELDGLNHYGLTAIEWQATTTHNERAPEEASREAMRRSGARHVNVVKGWFCDTLPTYPGEPIAILRCDGDWYSSTMETLTGLFPYVIPGGLIIFDDYYYWEGCAKAVHDFLAKMQAVETIRMSRGGYAYLIKR
jgi:O-methyltransferase